ncbi:GntP family permease [Enterococcus alcedinis]|uniref:D-serine permease n=1 Tax=Enterococcus alcedinis TaxID=1274384 RepID=A0A917N438_9ENTE|nr:GntP family permease [Enterococcus alcedinis]MBP2101414.1 GntP family gluconate:H+ symporter [Enterococcus alcedinis]GGI65193.1 D-serine permease [Enterococcus alcedinis]
MAALALVISILVLIFLSVKVKLHPFFALLTVSFVYGLLSKIGFLSILTLMKDAMGSATANLGLIVIIGTVTGGLLEVSGATDVIAKKIVAITGPKFASVGLALTGLIVSIPVFCSSAFILLAPLAKKISKEAKIDYMVMIISLSIGCLIPTTFIPPTPGPLAAMNVLSLDIGRVILVSLLFAIPLLIVLYFCSKWLGKKYPYPETDTDIQVEEVEAKFGFALAIAPILLPVVMIMLKTFVLDKLSAGSFVYGFLDIIGTTEIALALGLLLALALCLKNEKDDTIWQFDGIFGTSLRTGAQILMIICAGSAFGAVLQATELKDLLADIMVGSSLGLITPFLIGVIFRSAIGSITVSLLTATSIIAPAIPAMGYDSFTGTILIFLACASGAFMVFHGNDDMFWSVVTASKMDSKLAYKVLPLTSIIISLTGLVTVLALSFIIL